MVNETGRNTEPHGCWQRGTLLIKLLPGTKDWIFPSVVVSVAIVGISMLIGVNWKGLSDKTGQDDSY